MNHHETKALFSIDRENKEISHHRSEAWEIFKPKCFKLQVGQVFLIKSNYSLKQIYVSRPARVLSNAYSTHVKHFNFTYSRRDSIIGSDMSLATPLITLGNFSSSLRMIAVRVIKKWVLGPLVMLSLRCWTQFLRITCCNLIGLSEWLFLSLSSHAGKPLRRWIKQLIELIKTHSKSNLMSQWDSWDWVR